VLCTWKVDGPEAGACSCAFEDDGLVVDDVDMVGREEGNATVVAEYANGQQTVSEVRDVVRDSSSDWEHWER
jgi:hypothetical protein